MAGIKRRSSNLNWLKSLCQGISPNKPEKQLTKLLQKLFPNQWEYVGNGSFWLTSNGKHINPDFINTGGQKKIIEMFGDYWHSKKFTGTSNEQHEQERIDLLANKGYQTLVIWEHELSSTEQLVQKIEAFNDRTICE